MTKNRSRILAILESDVQPLNAHQVYDKIQNAPDLATIYRGLKFLEDEGFAESFVFECSDRGIERYYTLKQEHHIHYLHCENCHKFYPINSCPVESSLSDIQEQYNFKVNQHFFVIQGSCENCNS